MKMRMIQTPTICRQKPRTKPVDHFKKCPACGCDDLIDVRPDVLCTRCDWASMEWDVSRGGMDNLVAAAKEFGFSTLTSVSTIEGEPTELQPPGAEAQGA